MRNSRKSMMSCLMRFFQTHQKVPKMESEQNYNAIDFLIKRLQEIWRCNDGVELYLYQRFDDYIIQVDDEHINSDMLSSLKKDFINTFWLDTLVIEEISDNTYQLIWTNYLPF